MPAASWRERTAGLIPAGILLVMVLAAGLAALSTAHLFATIERLQALIATTRAEVDGTYSLLLALEHAELQARGYALTRARSYLDRARAALQEAGQHVRRLEALTPAGSLQARDLARLRALADAKGAMLDHAIETARSGAEPAFPGPSEAAERDTAGAQELGRAMVARAAAERSRLLRDLEQSEQVAGAVAFGALGAGLLLLGAASLSLLVSRGRIARARAMLQGEMIRLQAMVDHMRDGVAVFDPADRLLLWNAAFFPALQLPPSLARPGLPLAVLAESASDWTPSLPAFWPRDQATEAAEMRRSGRVLELWYSAMPDGGRMLAVADITRRMEIEAIARQAQKIEALGQLTGGIAHDFNNILHVIGANLELLGDRLPPGESALAARVAAAVAAVQRGSGLTHRLLAFARRQELAPKVVDTTALLRGMEDLLRRTLGQGVQVELRLPGDLGRVRADPNQLENALLNLAINARDAMPGGGRLLIMAENAPPAAGPPGLSGDFVTISVADTGTGMTTEQLGRAIEPFYTTKPEGRGTGLGLSMVHGFATQSGGTLVLESAPGRGTTVRLCIPRG